ncbi:MAG: response regulator [Cyanobacteria bacterium SZAS-4]|nr:response regulator [Cyanobacteria bacterium SZAS-4]
MAQRNCARDDWHRNRVGFSLFIWSRKLKISKILLVDDDPSIRRIAQITLSSVGKFDVKIAKSGSEALSMLLEERPDVVLMDVMMPEMDGPTTLAKLRTMPGFADLPVIFMTARIQKHELERLGILGATGVITKPFDPLYLCSQIQAILDGACFFSPETVTA